MKHRIAGALAIFLAIANAGRSLAEGATDTASDPAWDAMQEIFSPPQTPITSDNCDVALTVDFDKFQAKMAVFREAWFYKDRPTEFYQRRGHQILAIIARKQATLVTQAVFGTSQGPVAASCRFRFFVANRDQFGHDKPYVLVSWRFTKELAAKVNWSNLEDAKFPNLAIEYRLGQEFLNQMRSEPQ